MTGRRIKEIAPLPSGYVGVYRAPDGKGWQAYVMGERNLILLGSKSAAVAARANYWKTKHHAVEGST